MKKNNYPWLKWYNKNQKKIDYPQGNCYDSLKHTVDLYPEYFAYNYFGVEKKYSEILMEVDRVSRSLVRIGVKKGDYITICSSNVPEAVLSYYAINKLGAIANMVHPKTSIEELKYFLDLTKSKVMIALDSVVAPFLGALEETSVEKLVLFDVFRSGPEVSRVGVERVKLTSERVDILEWDAFCDLGQEEKNPESVGTKEDCCAVLYSGGTTGKPKGVMLSNGNLNALAYQGWYAVDNLEAGDSMLAVMPIFHGFGLGICIHTSFSFGMKAILQPKLDVQNFDKLIVDYRPSMITGVPTIYEFLLKSEKLHDVDLSFVKWMSCGGDSMTTSMKHKINAFLAARNAKVTVKEGYGLTECVTGTCLMPKDVDRDGSVGIPYTDTVYRIVKPGTFEELPYGTIGEIIMNAPTVMMGYLGNEVETKKALQVDAEGDVWFFTGDLGYMDEDGFIYYKQRMKRMIISSGYNIYPEQIEEAIEKSQHVLASSVVGIPNEERGEIPVAFIVLKNSETDRRNALAGIEESVNRNVSKYAIPKDYIFMSALPKTAVGKIDYQKLIKDYLSGKE